MIYFSLAISLLTLVTVLIILHRIVGLEALIAHELLLFSEFMTDRVNAFLQVFRKSKHEKNTDVD